MDISISPFAPENLVSLDRFGSPVPCNLADLHTRAESGAYLRDFSRFLRRCTIIDVNRHTPSGIASLSGHAIAYRWHSLPRVHRHGANKPQGSSKRVLPRQVTIDHLICASLSHTHYWYEVATLEIPLYNRAFKAHPFAYYTDGFHVKLRCNP